MKKIIFTLFSISFIFILTACPDAADESESIILKNNLQNEDLLFVFKMGYSEQHPDTFQCPDTLLPMEKYGNVILRNKAELIYSNIPDCPKFHVFILSIDTVNKYSWEQIRKDYNILKRYDIDGRDGLKSINYTISYPF